MKKSLSELAIFAGTPAFSEKLHIGRPNIGKRQHLFERINSILDSRWLTNYGPFVEEFEQQIAENLGVKHCIAMCNGTIALEISIRAAGLSGEVIVPSFTFIATAHSLQWQEITPVFCDIDAETFTIDPSKIEALITPRTTGIIGVHLWGRPCDIDGLTDIAVKNNLTLLFDASHAFECSYHGKMIGNFGTAEVFSFHATKFLNSFEGGAVVTNDDELAKKIRLMKNFGFAGYDNVIYIGTNGKMTEICAAMGLTSLESVNDFIAVNRFNYYKYKEQFKGIKGVDLLTYDESEKLNFQYITLLIDETVSKITRDELCQILKAENILARRYFYPGCHRMEPYRSYFPHAGLLLPQTEKLVDQVLSLPTGTSVKEADVDKICDLIRFIIAHGPAIRKKMHNKRQGNTILACSQTLT
jgi:dTDP-4-amino-4,6-dideoxygalactose transaminase